jgi:hypothetical protein
MATVGFPSVTPLRDRSPVALSIEQIRQRLAALDAEVTRLGSVADATTVATQVQALQKTSQQLALRVTALESALGTTDTFTLTAASAVAQFDIVVPAGPNQCKTADPSDPTARNGALGIALVSAGIGSPVTIQRRGQLTLPISGLTVGRPVFAGPGGEITQDPTYAAAALLMGVAMATSTIWVSPSQAVLVVPGHYSDPFDDAMPISWGTVAPFVRMLEGLVGRPNGYVVFVDGALDTTGTISGHP